MDWPYRYSARSGYGERISVGWVYASSEDDAWRRIRHLGARPIDIDFDWGQALLATLRPGMDQRELATFYAALARQFAIGGHSIRILEDARDFVSDRRLVAAVESMQTAVRKGASLSQAMAVAGLPARDVAIMQAMDSAGKIPDALHMLAREARRRFTVGRAIKRLARTPMVFFSVMFAVAYGVLIWAAPRLHRVLAALPHAERSMPALSKQFFALSDWSAAHAGVFSAAYLAVGIGVVVFIKSALMLRLIHAIPVLRNIAQRAELGMLWSAFHVMLDARVHQVHGAQILSRAAEQPDNRRRFEALAKALATGRDIESSVRAADFPEYVVRPISAAMRSDHLLDGLRDLADALAEDVVDLSERLTGVLDDSMKIAMAMLLFLFAVLTIYPFFQAIFAQV